MIIFAKKNALNFFFLKFENSLYFWAPIMTKNVMVYTRGFPKNSKEFINKN